MPQYVGLEQQGFYKPFEILAAGLQRRQANKLAQQEAGLAQERLGMEKSRLAMDQQQIQDSLATSSLNRNRLTGENEDAAAKRSRDKALRGLGDVKLAPDIAGLHFQRQAPEVQNFILQAAQSQDPSVTPAEVAAAFNSNVSAVTGSLPPVKLNMPTDVPAGYRVTEAVQKEGEPATFSIKPNPVAPVARPLLDVNGNPVPGHSVVGEDKIISTASAPRLTQADEALAVNTSEIQRNLEQLKKVVQDYGTFEAALPGGIGSSAKGTNSGMTSTEASAALKSLPYKIAIAYAKMVDPATAAREGEVQAAQKYLIPMGFTANNAQSLAVIDEMLSEASRRSAAYQALQAQRIPGSAPIGASLPPVSTGPAPTQPGGTKTVSSQQEYDALPAGSLYIDSTGATKRKK